MSDTPRIYKDADGNPCPLLRLIKLEPEWAENQILHRDKLERELSAVNEEAERYRLKTLVMDAKISDVTAQRDALREGVAAVTSERDVAQRELSRYRADLEAMILKIKEVTAQRDELDEAFAREQAYLVDSSNKNDALERERDQARSELAAVTKERDRLRDKKWEWITKLESDLSASQQEVSRLRELIENAAQHGAILTESFKTAALSLTPAPIHK